MMKKFVQFLRKPKWRFGSYSALMMSLLIAIGVLVNIAVETLETNYGWRRDLSFNGYTFTGEETQKALDTLREPVTLYLLYQGDVDSQLNEVLQHYRLLSDRITVTAIDLTRNPGFVTLFEGDLQSSVTADSIVVSCEATDRYKIISYEDFITQGYNIDTGTFEIAGLAFEKSITEAILYVSQADVPVVGISQGHGELSTTTLATLINFLQDNGYDVRTVDLLSGDTLDGIDMLLIADPYKDFTTGEIQTLKDFAQAGGSFFVIRDYTDALDLQNYQALLRSYGVVPIPGIVVASEKDTGSYYGERIYLLPYFETLDMTAPLIENGIDVLLLVGASAFETPQQTDNSLSAAVVLKSGPNAYVRELTDNDGSIDYQEGDLQGEMTLAILAARMHSDGSISRMFAIGNSTVFTDEYIYQRTFNQQFILQLMGELLPQKPISLDIIAKTALHPGLVVQSAAPAIALLAALPALLLLLALYVLLPRRNRQRLKHQLQAQLARAVFRLPTALEPPERIQGGSPRLSRSDPKGFRRFLPLLLLTGVLGLAAALVLLLPLIQESFPAKKTLPVVYSPTYQTVAQLDPDALLTITVAHADGESYTLVCEDGILSLRTGEGTLEPISKTISDQFIKYATTIYVEDTIAADAGEVADELPAMGLQPPQIFVTASFADGSACSVSLGLPMLDTTYHYYMWSGDNSIYLCNTGVYETFAYTADMLRTVTQPVIVSSLIERVSIRLGDAEPIVCALETDDEGTVRGALENPYAYPMDAEAAEALLSAVKNFRLGVRLQPLTGETLALYGLDTPQAVVTIDQRGGLYSQITDNGALISGNLEPSTLTLSLGEADGDFFRYCAYDGIGYRVSSFLVNAFLHADALEYATRYPADMGGETITGITARTADGTLDIRASYLETVLPNNELETDEYGNTVYTTQATCNGEAITAEAFENLVARLGQMAVSGALNSAARPSGTPVLQMVLTTAQGTVRTLAAYPMDAFHDVLAVDGVALHYISNEALEIALGEFSALLSPPETP